MVDGTAQVAFGEGGAERLVSEAGPGEATSVFWRGIRPSPWFFLSTHLLP
jgi:hypothetical protein